MCLHTLSLSLCVRARPSFLPHTHPLYANTGPMFAWYNEVLRNKDTPKEHVRAALAHIAEWKRMESKGDKFPFTTTIHVINSAIIKLSRAQKAEKVFRGTKGGRLPDKFWTPNSDNIRGGIEVAFMSTTTNREVAMNFASSGNEPSIIFEIQVIVRAHLALSFCNMCSFSHRWE